MRTTIKVLKCLIKVKIDSHGFPSEAQVNSKIHARLHFEAVTYSEVG